MKHTKNRLNHTMRMLDQIQLVGNKVIGLERVLDKQAVDKVNQLHSLFHQTNLL